MIAYIKGTIKRKSDNFVIVDNNGLGYKVYVRQNAIEHVGDGEQIELYTHQYIREDALDLYGFIEFDELHLFEKLIGVSGIGPKTALGVFAVASVQDIKSAIINEDASILKKVSGIGAKTAERIVLELKNKVGGVVGVDLSSKESMSADADVVEALESLGYSPAQSREALQHVDKTETDVSIKVKKALQFLSQ